MPKRDDKCLSASSLYLSKKEGTFLDVLLVEVVIGCHASRANGCVCVYI